MKWNVDGKNTCIYSQTMLKFQSISNTNRSMCPCMLASMGELKFQIVKIHTLLKKAN